MMNQLMSAVVRQVTGLKIQAALFQPAELSIKTVLMLLLDLSGRNFGALLTAGIFFWVILYPALQNMWCKYPEENRDLGVLIRRCALLGLLVGLWFNNVCDHHCWSEANQQLLGVQ